jgi:phage portal protein BeeE
MGTLRQIAGVYDILRKCIDVRKDEFCSLSFQVIARDKDRRRAREVIKDQQSKIREIEDFFAFPDRKNTWQSWLRTLLEDYFVLDAATLWKHRDFGGNLIGLRVLDGALIKPILTIEGDTPIPPDTAYQQYVWGVNRWNFTADELIYAPKNRRVHTPYGLSPVEEFLTHITLALRHQRFSLDYFTSGTIPEGVAEAPASWSPKQIQDFNQIWDRMLAGDSRALHKLRFVPAGFKFHQFKDYNFDSTFAAWLVSVTCAAFDLQPQELGFEPIHGGLGGKGFSEEQSVILKRKAIEPLLRWLLDEIINPIIWEEFNAPDLVGTLISSSDVNEKLQMMQARDLAIRNGTLSIDEAIEMDGGEPVGIDRLFVTGHAILGMPDLLALSKVGSIALNVQGTPLPEGNKQTPAGLTASENQKGGENPVAAKAEAKAQPQLPSPSSTKAPVEGAKATVPAGVVVDPREAQKAAAAEVQTGDAVRKHASDTKVANLEHTRETSNTGKVARSRAARLSTAPEITKSEIEAELAQFTRFANARKRDGRWRPFQSEILPEEVLNILNATAEADLKSA